MSKRGSRFVRRALVCGLALGVAASVAGAAQARSLTVIPAYADPLGGTTEVHGLNDTGWMTGAIVRPNNTYVGFIRDPNGNYTTFSNDVFTEGRAIDDANNISVQTIGASGISKIDGHELIRHADGSTTTLLNPATSGPLRGTPGGFDTTGDMVGDFYDPLIFGARHGFVDSGGVITPFDVPGHIATYARGINDAGSIVGFYGDINGISNPGFYEIGGVFHTLNIPGSEQTALEDINDAGIAVGGWNDAAGNEHPFMFDTNTGVLTNFKVPGGFGNAWAIDEAGRVVISTNSGFGGASWLFNPAGTPEPGTWSLLIAGFGLAGAALRRRRAALA